MPALKPLALRSLVFVVALAAALAGAEALRPTHHLAKDRPPIDLQAQVPRQFGEWREVQDQKPLQPDPELQQRLDALYTQTLARTYINATGQRVMLSIAYGSDQNSEATAVHRPEFCYGAQGFRVSNRGTTELQLGPTRLPLQRLLAQQGARVEPVTYWVTLDTKATLPGVGRKLTQLEYGLQGKIADGMLVRVSTISSLGEVSQFELQEQFLRDFHATLSAGLKGRYFGDKSNESI